MGGPLVFSLVNANKLETNPYTEGKKSGYEKAATKHEKIYADTEEKHIQLNDKLDNEFNKEITELDAEVEVLDVLETERK